MSGWYHYRISEPWQLSFNNDIICFCLLRNVRMCDSLKSDRFGTRIFPSSK